MEIVGHKRDRAQQAPEKWLATADHARIKRDPSLSDTIEKHASA